MNNPYSTPEANLETSDGNELYLQLPRFSCWGVFGLTFITAGIYYMYWLYKRTEMLNAVAIKPIPKWLIVTTMISYVIYFPVSYMPESMLSEILYLNILIGATIVYFVFYYWWVFAFKNQLKLLSVGSNVKIGGFLTFLLQVIYLQYKINELHDLKNA